MSFFAELRRRWWLLLLLVALLVVFFGRALATFYTDVLWFDSLGFLSVFWTLLGTQLGTGIAVGLVVFALVATNLLLARRLAPPYRIPSEQEETIERYREALEPYAKPLLLGVALVVGLLSGLSLAGEWRTVLLFLGGGTFGEVDPQFGRDLGYFVFDLPFWEGVNSWLFTSLIVTIVLTAVAHYVFGGIRPQSPGQKIAPQVNVHLSILLALAVGVRAWGFVLDQHLLSFSERGVTMGVNYTDATAQVLAYQVLAIVSAVVAVLFLANIIVRTWWVPAGGLALLIVVGIVLAGVYPAAIQAFRVEPQELELESQYIERNIEWTRFGFGLTVGQDLEEIDAGGAQSVSGEEVEASTPTLSALRLWDPAVLQTSFEQTQARRRFYEFPSVDVDRYEIDDELRQVMLSSREINVDNLGDESSWENRHLVYTHGYGVVAADVNQATGTGDPVLVAQDMPQRGEGPFDADNPRLYMAGDGTRAPEYSVVGTELDEFDYPVDEGEGGEDRSYRYTGADGVQVGGVLNRVAFALRFADRNILLSGLIDADSDVLFNRSVRERVEEIAPFLELDHDPYPVVVDDRVKWIQDAYTTSDMIPYSERVDLGALTPTEQIEFEVVATGEGEVQLQETVVERPGLEGSANYIRNSVKVVVDAYDGTVDFYVVDDDDPVLEAWESVFPEVFTDVEEADEDLRSHFRYPEDIFRVQAGVYRRYHVDNIPRFYQGEDHWSIPRDAAAALNAGDSPGDGDRQMRPHYQLMQLPGEDEREFALVQPFTPRDRPVLSGWLVGRSDGENLGELKGYQLPRGDDTRWGPNQFTGNIQAGGALANLIGVWNRSNASVIYGNTIVLPVADSQVYAQPVFLQPEGEGSEALPKLRLVIVAHDDELVWSTSLTQALRELYGDDLPDIPETGGVDPEIIEEELEEEDVFDEEFEELPDDGPEDGLPADPGDLADVDPEIAELLNEAMEAFEAAEAALSDGELGTYQEESRRGQQLVDDALRRFDDLDETAAAD